jgi:RNA polymerase sigma-70 factor (ECF subfamily)
LLKRVQASDPAAWQVFAQVYGPVVYSWVRQSGLQEADASDVVQETFRTLVTRIGTFRKANPGDSLRGGLWTITRNKIRDHFRHQAGRAQTVGGTDHRLLLEAIPDAPPDESSRTGPSASENYLHHHLLQTLQAEFEPRTWQAFWDVAVQGRRPADVANDLQMSIGAVYMAKSRVLKRLRQEMND